jgi:ribose transport system ATP-binding protein
VVSSAADAVWLEARGLTKRYGGVVALDDASLNVRAGEVRGLVGANGAGKSTLVKCLTGLVQPAAGEVLVDGRRLSFGRPSESLRAGIASVPQELTVAPTMSVAENVMLGREPRRFGWIRGRRLRRDAAEVLSSLSLDVALDEPVGGLALIEQRLVMIARALSSSARLVIFDEPTATLSPFEAQTLLDAIRRLTGRGVSVLYVSHHLSEVEELCDAVTVLRDGSVLAELTGRHVTHAALVELLASDEESSRPSPGETQAAAAERVLVADELETERLHGVSVSVRSGEIVGLAGLAGSGARELLLALCGAVPVAGGTMAVGGRRLRPGRSTRAVAAGVGFLPGDRSLGTFPSHSLRHNVGLADLRSHSFGPFVDRRSERSAVAALLDRVGLHADQEAPISSLSGGNQQKALVARWIGSGARLLLLDDPTAGVDVATRPEIHAQVRGLAASGAAVLLASTDVEELCQLSGRVLVFERGAITGELAGDRLTPARVLAAMTGRPGGALAHPDPPETRRTP